MSFCLVYKWALSQACGQSIICSKVQGPSVVRMNSLGPMKSFEVVRLDEGADNDVCDQCKARVESSTIAGLRRSPTVHVVTVLRVPEWGQ